MLKFLGRILLYSILIAVIFFLYNRFADKKSAATDISKNDFQESEKTFLKTREPLQEAAQTTTNDESEESQIPKESHIQRHQNPFPKSDAYNWLYHHEPANNQDPKTDESHDKYTSLKGQLSNIRLIDLTKGYHFFLDENLVARLKNLSNFQLSIFFQQRIVLKSVEDSSPDLPICGIYLTNKEEGEAPSNDKVTKPILLFVDHVEDMGLLYPGYHGTRLVFEASPPNNDNGWVKQIDCFIHDSKESFSNYRDLTAIHLFGTIGTKTALLPPID